MGKGGVGKTTVSAAYAAWLARKNPQTTILLISTDPAHSLADVLNLSKETGQAPSLQAGSRLAKGQPARITTQWEALEVNAEERFRKFLEHYRKPLMEIVEAGTMFERGEIEPMLETTLPGMAEISGLLAINDALSSGKYEHIIVDTAPFGHTLRLLQMPEAFARLLRFLEVAAGRDAVLAAHFGGKVDARGPALLGEWRALVEQMLEMLRQRARLALVATPEPFALAESARVARQMAPLKFEQVILNRMVTRHPGCERCAARVRAAKEALGFLKKGFVGVLVRVGEDPGEPILGVEALAEFGERVFASQGLRKRKSIDSSPRSFASLNRTTRNDRRSSLGPTEGVFFRKTRERRGKPRLDIEAAEEPALERVAWPAIKKKLALTLGKGGVGKTTISAALAWRIRQTNKEMAVVVCSTDPAPSLDDVFAAPVGDHISAVADDPKLQAAEIDAAAEFQSWAAQMKATLRNALAPQAGGVHVDLTFERELFEALLDIVPPGVDEIFGVLRLSDLLADGTMVILDMAPTGHALELLRTPERMLLWARLLLKTLAQHRTLPLARDLGAEIVRLASRVRQLAAALLNRQATAVNVVALAEPLPDRETERLMRQLGALRMKPAALFVNRVLFAQDTGECEHCRSRREWQLRSLQRMSNRAPVVYVVREREHGPSGAKELTEFTRELWKLA
jgi:arsenite-transporting ATPase